MTLKSNKIHFTCRLQQHTIKCAVVLRMSVSDNNYYLQKNNGQYTGILCLIGVYFSDSKYIEGWGLHKLKLRKGVEFNLQWQVTTNDNESFMTTLIFKIIFCKLVAIAQDSINHCLVLIQVFRCPLRKKSSRVVLIFDSGTKFSKEVNAL